ncbi:MAG: 16S rRNA (cytidine(1402)-2'-O)-methyltransferase [Gammaproteobacteria bacterium]|nr:16S rRNA (cytidine(1402)-2'-O)-methyltransferase [Gammaproteobacteria bacterium]MCW8927963.1 16S rRNA (cytidine(1402)-2'-O)-methyltransferase [Gammaproteobacteria bacterium]MCW8959723.1 16S rRNA (cytidine(1402)-2'-O)-methyltransferase [Gammaproteobacteria bacterium]MCW8971920.1 16S rRNA (cytidine(1402)-2'-O)-methyltransferase [Gammaproteobacteria bacterium]MCW8991779.1 16S rRNA (cytidine(1402)-2'-O)-methyltransferase [Gammaproteobacteria bacterium]
MQAGILYVVATPIGNLGDLSPRAVDILQRVDRIAAEDTRHSAGLMRHFAITTPMLSLHEHNERQKTQLLLQRLEGGESIALIADAGTPLISDPGYILVREAHMAGLRVVPIPGPSALIAALSASGLPTDRFSFEGFLPAKDGARRKLLEALAQERRTLAFYESPHRILDSLADMAGIFGETREAVVARELTKTFETIRHDNLGNLLEWMRGDANQQKGEFVVLVGEAPKDEGGEGPAAEACRIADILVQELPVKQAAALAASISGEKKNALYKYLLDRG